MSCRHQRKKHRPLWSVRRIAFALIGGIYLGLPMAGCMHPGAPAIAQPAALATAAPEKTPEAAKREYLIQRFVSSTSKWLYLDGEQPRLHHIEDMKWTLPGYDAIHWRYGAGPFGAKDGKLASLAEGFRPSTLFDAYLENGENAPSFFLRTSFQVEDPSAIHLLRCKVAYDDALVLFLNGETVFEGNVPEGGFADCYSYGAANPQGDPISAEFPIRAELLREGENVLAAQLHQSDAHSSDIYFELISLDSVLGEYSSSFVGVGPDATGVSFNWVQEGRRTEDAGVYIRKLGSEDSLWYPAEAIEENDVGYSYRAAIGGLAGNTRYGYTITGGAHPLYNGAFRTGDPEDGTDMLLLGDPQLDMDDYMDYTGSFSRALELASEGMDMVVCLGDVAVNAWDYPVYEAAMDCLDASGLPAAMLFGNHDEADDCLSDSVNLPNMTQYGAIEESGVMSGNYWFAYGGNLFFCLNTNVTDVAEHRAFLEMAAEAYREAYGEPVWKIVFMHHAPFGQGNNNMKDDIVLLREDLTPVLSEFDVDAVFSGHDHSYSRSYLMHGSEIVPYEGQQATRQPGETLYVTLSSATGAKFYDLSDVEPYTAFCEQTYRAMLSRINITPKRLQIVTWEPDTGEEIDNFTLLK